MAILKWQKYAKLSKFFLLHGKGTWGHILTKETHRDTPGTPQKNGFFDLKRPKEGERVAPGHFYERGD